MTDKKNSSKQKKAKPSLFMGLFATGMGLFIILVSVDIIHTDPASIHAPRWVLTLAGLMFALVGLHLLSTTLLSPGEQRTPIIRWVQYFLLLGMLTAFSTVFLWVGFGGGEREFSSSGSFLFFTISGKGNDILGRIVFGGGGILATLITGYYAFSEARKIMSQPSDRDSLWD